MAVKEIAGLVVAKAAPTPPFLAVSHITTALVVEAEDKGCAKERWTSGSGAWICPAPEKVPVHVTTTAHSDYNERPQAGSTATPWNLGLYKGQCKGGRSPTAAQRLRGAISTVCNVYALSSWEEGHLPNQTGEFYDEAHSSCAGSFVAWLRAGPSKGL